MAFPSGFEPGLSGSGVPENAAVRLNRREGVALYDCTAMKFSHPVKVDVDPELWSPAKLKLLAAEALRRQLFVDEFAEAGGLKTFGHGGKFNGAVLRRVADEPYISFMQRINAWLASNPRPPFPALPEAVPLDVSSDVSAGDDSWSFEDVVQYHRSDVMSPEHLGNPKSGSS